MNTKDTGGPAFPETPLSGGHPGMTLRDWFAGQALAGIVSRPGVCLSEESSGAAVMAYQIADMMISERNKQ